jgi:hypothetical protein
LEVGPVDDVGESLFEGFDGFLFRGSCFDPSFDECLWIGMHPDLGDRNPVERSVGLPVPSPVGAESGVVG